MHDRRSVLPACALVQALLKPSPTQTEAALKSTDLSAFELTAMDLPRANAAGVEVLRVAFDFRATLDSRAFAALSDYERASAARFLRHDDALRHAATRAALRAVLSERLDVRPDALRFERD